MSKGTTTAAPESTDDMARIADALEQLVAVGQRILAEMRSGDGTTRFEMAAAGLERAVRPVGEGIAELNRINASLAAERREARMAHEAVARHLRGE